MKDAFLKLKINTENIKMTYECVQMFEAMQGARGSIRGADYRGVRVWAGRSYIPRTQWTLVAQLDEREALLSLVRMRNIIIMVFLLVPVASGLIGTYISRIISEPICRLHEVVEKIGQGELDNKVATDANDEI